MKKTILILLTVLLAVSCSQVVYDNLPSADIGGASTTVKATQQDTSRNILLTFEPVPYVAAYAYSFDDGTPIPFEADEYENGMLSYQIYASRVPANKGTVNLFGRVSGSDKWVCLGDIGYEIVINGEIPDAYVYERNEKNVVVNINPASNGKEYLYRLVVMTLDEEILYATKDFIKAENGSITIESPKEKCLINVYQRESLEAPVEEAYATIEVYEFSNTVGLDLTVDDSGFHVSGITSNTTEIALKNRDNTSLNIVVKDIDAGNGGTIDIPFEDVPSLESGLFYVYSPNGGVVSNNVKTRTSVSIFSTTPNYRSVDLEINFSSLIDVSSIKFSATDSTTAYSVDVVSVDSDNKTIISITDLDSNTTYDTDQITLAIDGIDIAISEFATKSFAGKFFEWKGTLDKGGFFGTKHNTNFVLFVDNAPSGSAFPYYVYLSENDDSLSGKENPTNYSKSKYRIMPLLDNSDGLGSEKEPVIDQYVFYNTGLSNDGVDFKIYNESYKKNANKWNGSPLTPGTWKIENPDADKEKDVVLTITFTGLGSSNPDSSLQTDTSFEFLETRNENNKAIPYIKFKNIGSPTVQMGLYINAGYEQEWTDFEDKQDSNSKYCWYLALVDPSEGDVE